MKNTANILIIVGGLITLSPFAYLYLTHSLVAQTMSIVLVQRPEMDKINFKPVLPEYYIPICLMIGVICISIGVFFAWRNVRQDSL